MAFCQVLYPFLSYSTFLQGSIVYLFQVGIATLSDTTAVPESEREVEREDPGPDIHPVKKAPGQIPLLEDDVTYIDLTVGVIIITITISVMLS